MIEERQTYGMPALLSLWSPGLGQVVKGQFAKGVLIFAGAIISLLISTMVPLFPLILLAVWAFNIFDAYYSTE